VTTLPSTKLVSWAEDFLKKTLLIAAVIASTISCQGVSAESTATIKLTDLNKLDIKKTVASFAAKADTLIKDSPSTFMFTAPSIDTFEVMPVRFEPEQSFLFNAYRCGLIFSSLKHPKQMLTTIGIDETEALSCNNIVSLGTISTVDNKMHLGIIYENLSPNTTFQDAIILSWSKENKRWYINQSLMDEKIADKGSDNLWALQKALRQ
jgi:hypothetical protein